MKPHEVGIIIAVVAVIGFLWWKNQSSDSTASPVNATSPGFVNYGPMRPVCGGGA